MNRQIYLAVKVDRQFDDKYLAFTNLDDAIIICQSWKNEYEDRFPFRKFETYDMEYNGYLYFAETPNQEYSVRVELIDFVDDKGE